MTEWVIYKDKRGVNRSNIGESGLSKSFGSFLCYSFALLLCATSAFGQNTLNARLFYVKPVLYHSKSKATRLNLSRYDVVVALPEDHRADFYGELVYKNTKVHALDEFFRSPTMNEIQSKIEEDLKKFNVGKARNVHHDKIGIATAVEVFYPKVSGFLNGKSFAKVRLALIATLNDSLLIKNTYESFYITNGVDHEFEGDLDMTVEDGTNVTIGMALRQTLDQFYNDLNFALTRKNKMIVTGIITSAKTKQGVAAQVVFTSDSSYTATTAADGKFRIVIAAARPHSAQITASGFVNFSSTFTGGATLKVIKKDFQLQPIEIGALVKLDNVLFYMGTTDLLQESYAELNGVVAFLKKNAKVRIELRGHTDNQGDANKDVILSQQRVDRIKAYLVSKGINTRRITGKGFGGAQPISSNATEEGRKLNRRVEFVILKN
ncbi:MAG: OmpA family protein [Bacteroidetes bacterium]|nr:OmpA family protein [Bacteroidota bacterium]